MAGSFCRGTPSGDGGASAAASHAALGQAERKQERCPDPLHGCLQQCAAPVSHRFHSGFTAGSAELLVVAALPSQRWARREVQACSPASSVLLSALTSVPGVSICCWICSGGAASVQPVQSAGASQCLQFPWVYFSLFYYFIFSSYSAFCGKKVDKIKHVHLH